MAPEQVTLATRPTPVQPLRRLSAWLGAEVLVKRDDLTGMALSGNKVRKLELLLAQALTRGADTVITCGGIQSNHCRATAVAARQLGLEPVLLLRGEPPAAVDGNLLWHGALDESKTVGTGDTMVIAAGNIKLKLE